MNSWGGKGDGIPDMKGGGGGMNGGTFMKGDESGGCIKSGGMPATPGFPNVCSAVGDWLCCDVAAAPVDVCVVGASAVDCGGAAGG